MSGRGRQSVGPDEVVSVEAVSVEAEAGIEFPSDNPDHLK